MRLWPRTLGGQLLALLLGALPALSRLAQIDYRRHFLRNESRETTSAPFAASSAAAFSGSGFFFVSADLVSADLAAGSARGFD